MTYITDEILDSVIENLNSLNEEEVSGLMQRYYLRLLYILD
jgi:hypothetical protein